MKIFVKIAVCVMVLVFVMGGFIACGRKSNNDESVSEQIELTSATLGEVEFENSDAVELKQESNVVVVSGKIDKMSNSQKMEFGVEDVTHVVVLKVKFDEERTIDTFEIKGEKTKVYSTDESVENYAGSISELLDSSDGEDAYVNLVLSANTKEYQLTSKYNDETKSVVKISIVASLVGGDSE